MWENNHLYELISNMIVLLKSKGKTKKREMWMDSLEVRAGKLFYKKKEKKSSTFEENIT